MTPLRPFDKLRANGFYHPPILTFSPPRGKDSCLDIFAYTKSLNNDE